MNAVIKICILFLTLSTLQCASARGVDKYEEDDFVCSFKLWCDGRWYAFDTETNEVDASTDVNQIVRYCHDVTHIDKLKNFLRHPKMKALYDKLNKMGTIRVLCTWRDEILNRGYTGKWNQYLRDRESGHVRRGTITSACLAAEHKLDREIKLSTKKAIDAGNECMKSCGGGINSGNRAIAERGYYEGSRCAQRVIRQICV